MMRAALPEEEAMSLDFDVFAVAPKPIPSAVPGFEQAVGPATWPPSTSTLISDDDGALLVDCLITEQEGRELAAWVKSHDRELRYVYITHPHADHFLGLPEILAEFPEARPVALAESIPAMEEQISPGYMQVWGGFFPGQLTGKPVPPVPLAGTTIPIGGSAATVIPVGTSDTGHSSLVHVPGLSLVVSGDVVYNQTHMWLMGSTPDSRVTPSTYSRTARALSTRSATYSSSRRIKDLGVGQYLIPDHPVQPVLRDEVNGPAEQFFQILLQRKVRHAKVIARNPHVQQVHVTVWSRGAACDRAEDCQFGDPVLAAQVSEPRAQCPDLIQGHRAALPSSPTTSLRSAQ
jgi:glyoxylase-like metal-dependent hydrolase (beta-lactamase superfamily II)